MSVICSQCGTAVESGKFCPACGAKLEEVREAEESVVMGYGMEEVKAEEINTPQETPMQQSTPVYQAPPVQQSQPVRQAPPVYQAAPVYQAPVQNPKAVDYVPRQGSEYEPISTGGYIGIFLLLSIPVVGFILSIVWACGGCQKINKRNLCRAMLLWTLIAVIIASIITAVFAVMVADSMSYYY